MTKIPLNLNIMTALQHTKSDLIHICPLSLIQMIPLLHGPVLIKAAKILLGGLVLFVIWDYARVLNLRRKLPPGPFPRPLIGNRWMLPRIRPWVKYEEWSVEYKSPIITVWLGSIPTIILNDAWVAAELLDKRASIYSSRPRMVFTAHSWLSSTGI
jgi:hypothetical protein